MMTSKRKTAWALEFGRLIRDRRRELGLTQQAVADGAGIHRTLLADYEREGAPERVPTDVTLRGLADALSVPVQTMFKWAGVRFPAVDVSIASDTPPELLAKLSSLEEAIRVLTERLDGQTRSNGSPAPVRRQPRRRPSS
jgi:transcriptional regulator with XRE-family HTH domain